MRILKKLKKSKKELSKNFFVFDTETTKLEPQPKNFVFGVIYGDEFTKVIHTVEDFKKEFSKKKYHKKILFAHNAEFDLLTIFGNIYTEIDRSAIFNGKFISARYQHTTFADSLNILPASVDSIGKTIGLAKLENKKIHTEGLTKLNVSNEDIDYCIRDCKIVYDALLEMFTRVGTIKITLASLSMYMFRSEFLKRDIIYSELTDEFFQSYYGGRTEAFVTGKVNCKVYDVNSLYPYAMTRVKFPDVRTLKKETMYNMDYFMYIIKNFEGLTKVKVKHQDYYFGLLPKRHNINGSNKLIFPVGEFETIVNFNELRYALSTGLVEVLETEYIVYSNRVDSIFIDFVEQIYNHRKIAKNELTRYIDKLLLNSNYGRWAMRMKYETTYYDLIPYEIISALQLTDKWYDLKTFSAERNDCFLITENEKFKNSFFAIATFSSYITSEARIILLQGLIDNIDNKVCYCDTDSIFLEKDFIGTVGKDLGQWKLEDKRVTEINGLKNYKYIDTDGTEKHTIKGISKNAKKLSENKYEVTRYKKTKEALRHDKESGKQEIQIKELTHKYDKRIINKNDGNTKPIKL